jgi:hypothetical protein
MASPQASMQHGRRREAVRPVPRTGFRGRSNLDPAGPSLTRVRSGLRADNLVNGNMAQIRLLRWLLRHDGARLPALEIVSRSGVPLLRGRFAGKLYDCLDRYSVHDIGCDNIESLPRYVECQGFVRIDTLHSFEAAGRTAAAGCRSHVPAKT